LRLSDETLIKCIQSGHIRVDPFIEENVQPASLDLRLGSMVTPFSDTWDSYIIDPRQLDTDRIYFPPEPSDGFVIRSHQCVLADTMEYVCVPSDLQVDVYGRSSLGRLGLLIHISAGFVDPGFEGTITLEIVNMGPKPFRLYEGMRIAQLAFNTMTAPAKNPYGAHRGSKYKGQTGPTMSRLDQDKENR